MTNKIALWMAVVIAAAISLDLWMEWGGVPFLMRKFLTFIDWIEFWR